MKSAKVAALMIMNKSSSNIDSKHEISSRTSTSLSKHAELLELEHANSLTALMESEGGLREENIMQYSADESEDLEPTHEELQILQEQLFKSIAVRSRRQTERKERRVRAAEKAAANVVSVKSGSLSKKKRASLQDVDYTDPLRYLRATTSSCKLLTATEETELSEGIQVEQVHVT